MRKESLEYKDGSTVCEGYIAHEPGAKKPCVLISHAWAGIFDQERQVADACASMGYVGFALDVYGKGIKGDPMGDNSALMGPWLNDRGKLKQRLFAAVQAAKAHPSVDPNRIAMIGYCFGGLCVLDVARSGTGDVRGVVSMHGLFTPPNLGPQAPIKTKVLVLHGWDDPMATPDSVLALAKEMTAAKADWQVHAYGHTLHAFTSEGANAPERGVKYDRQADRRSWAATTDFLKEVFA